VVRESIRYISISLISEPFMAWGIILGGVWAGPEIPKRHAPGRDGRVAGEDPLCYLCVTMLGLGATSIWWAMNASQVVQALLLTRRYVGKAWLKTQILWLTGAVHFSIMPFIPTRRLHMDLHEAIEKRRTIRVFKQGASEDQLKRIMLAGTKPPRRE